MDQPIDHFPLDQPTITRNFKKAKTLLKGMFIALIIGLILPASSSFLPMPADRRDLLLGIDLLIIILLAPTALFFITRSYLKKETLVHRRTLYLMGIIFFNLLSLLMLSIIIPLEL